MENFKSKLSLAIESLNEGKSILVNDLRFETNENGDIIIIGWSQYSNLLNLTKAIAIAELEAIKLEFYEMQNASFEFENFIKGKVHKFYLYFDDAGKVSIAVCEEKNGIVKWYVNLK